MLTSRFVTAPALGMDDWKFEESLRLPDLIEDREDQLEESRPAQPSTDAQSSGILLLDNEIDSEEEVEIRPALPPRPERSIKDGNALEEANVIKRRPAPTLQTPPRYSTLIPMPESNYANNVPLEEDLDNDDDLRVHYDLPAYHTASSEQTMSPPPTSPPPGIPRKPLPKTDQDG